MAVTPVKTQDAYLYTAVVCNTCVPVSTFTIRSIAVFTLIIVDMGVHDNADSKYIVMGTSSFSKLAPKRPTTVVFNESSSKIQKFEDNQQNVQAENVDKGNISLQQQRKSLPVYKLRKR